MEESHSKDETNYQLTTVSNPDLPDVEKPMLELTFKEPNGNSHQDISAAIVASWLGVTLAGGLYPVVIQFVGFTISMIVYGPRFRDSMGGLDQIDIAFMNAVLWIALSAILGVFVAALACSVAGIFTLMTNWSFGGILTPRIAVSCCGGLAGFLATFPIWIGISVDQIPLAAASISFLAMAMGHVGGMLAVWKIDPALLIRRPSTKPHYQFQIRHLLVATAWFAAIAAIDGTSGNLFFSKMLGTWLVAQALLISADFLWLKFGAKKRSFRISPTKTSL